jgi:transcriptional regulator with XRE-family HTH domain
MRNPPNNTNDPSFGHRITTAFRQSKFYNPKIERGFNQSEISRHFDLSHATVNYWCSGQRYPMMDTALKVANHLSLSLTYLFQGIGPMHTTYPFFTLSPSELTKVEAFITEMRKK